MRRSSSHRIRLPAARRLQWRVRFDGIKVETRLSMTAANRRLSDQAALHGALATMRGLGSEIASVETLTPGEEA